MVSNKKRMYSNKYICWILPEINFLGLLIERNTSWNPVFCHRKLLVVDYFRILSSVFLVVDSKGHIIKSSVKTPALNLRSLFHRVWMKLSHVNCFTPRPSLFIDLCVSHTSTLPLTVSCSYSWRTGFCPSSAHQDLSPSDWTSPCGLTVSMLFWLSARILQHKLYVRGEEAENTLHAIAVFVFLRLYKDRRATKCLLTLIQVKRENDKIDLGLNWKIFHFVFTCPRTIWHDLSQTIMETFVA